MGMVFFAYRMLKTEPRGEYADVLERLLYNGTISGMALDGKSFFYVNPLEVYPKKDREVEAFRHVKAALPTWPVWQALWAPIFTRRVRTGSLSICI